MAWFESQHAAPSWPSSVHNFVGQAIQGVYCNRNPNRNPNCKPNREPNHGHDLKYNDNLTYAQHKSHP